MSEKLNISAKRHGHWLSGFEGRTFMAIYHLRWAYVQIHLLHAVNPSLEARRWHPCHRRPQMHLHLVSNVSSI
ncbi:hypothetical protein [Shewanella marisflavi]|uniref:hypothetical protein n=1 Tax=Shewanella marisflavi TaxID=260364 RepID=UPI003AAA7516